MGLAGARALQTREANQGRGRPGGWLRSAALGEMPGARPGPTSADRLRTCRPGVARTEVAGVEAALEPLELRLGRPMVRLAVLRGVLVAGVGVPRLQLGPVLVGDVELLARHVQEHALEALRLQLEAPAEGVALLLRRLVVRGRVRV